MADKVYPMVYAFIWDFDGIIVFTPHEEAWRIAAETYGAKGFTSDFYQKYVSGKPRLEGGRAILELLGVYKALGVNTEKEKEKLLIEFTNYKNKVFRELIERGVYKVNWDTIEFIKGSKKHGIVQVLASASRNARPIADMVNVYGRRLIELFDVDVSGKGSSKKEVFAKAIEYVIKRYGFLECGIVFEDAPSGIVVAKELGLKAIGYRDPGLKEHGADLIVYSFKDLDPLKILSSLRCL